MVTMGYSIEVGAPLLEDTSGTCSSSSGLMPVHALFLCSNCAAAIPETEDVFMRCDQSFCSTRCRQTCPYQIDSPNNGGLMRPLGRSELSVSQHLNSFCEDHDEGEFHTSWTFTKVVGGRLVDELTSLIFVPIRDLAVRYLRSSPDEQEWEYEGSSGVNLRSAFDSNSAQKDFGLERMISSSSSTECPSLVTSDSE